MAPPTNHGTHIRRRSNHTILRHTTHHARKNTMTEDYPLPPVYSRSDYRGALNYEGVLAGHIQKIMQYRDTDMKRYCSSVETLIIFSPRNIRTNALEKLISIGLKRGSYNGITEDKQLLYDDLLIYINELLEENNLIFKTGSFEVGHD